MSSPTIKDVARSAGVSVASVSRVLNGYSDVSEEMREKVLAVVQELRYYPKASAQHLVTKTTQVVGVFFRAHDGSGMRHPFVGAVLTAFAQEIGRAGYDLMWFVNQQDPFENWGFLDRIRHRDVDGVLMIGKPEQNLDELLASSVPVVTLDFPGSGPRVGSVMSDNRSAVMKAVHSLVRSGYQRIGFVHGPLEFVPAMERLQGFYAGMAQMGFPIESDWIVPGDFTLIGGRHAAQQFLRLERRPEVIIFSADLSAMGAMQVFREQGLRIPEDLAIVGFDDIDAAAWVSPRLTTIRQDAKQMGDTSAQLLVTMMTDASDIPRHYMVPTELVSRESTRPLSPAIDRREERVESNG